MASAYSGQRQYNQYESPIDLNLANTVIATKQGQYDANLAKVDAMIESYTNMPLVREEDKKVLYQNIMNLENQINSFSKMELTNSNTLRGIQQSLQSAITPYIAEQFKNSQKIVNFQTEMAKKREKNPELWNDANYLDALDQAGYTDYINGVDKNGTKVDKLGELRYSDYYDINKNLNEPLEQWAKSEFGATKYVDESEPNGYYFKTESGKRLTESEIQSFVTSRINSDPKLLNQVGINARSSFRGMSDEDFMKNWTSTITAQKEVLETGITQIDEKLKLAESGSQEHAYYTAQKEAAENDMKSIQDIIDGKVTPSRKSIEFNMYTNNLKNTLAKTYAFESVDKIDYNDMPFKIKKFETETALKERELMLKEFQLDGKNSTGELVGQGTEFDIPQQLSDVDVTVSERIQQTYESASTSALNLLSQVDPKIGSLTPAQKTAKLKAVAEAIENMPIDQSVYSAETIQAVMSWKAANEANLNYRKEINGTWQPKIDESYNRLLGARGRTNLDELSRTAPNVVSYIKQGKNLSQLSTDQKNLVRAELSQNMIRYGDADNETMSELKTFNHNFKKALSGELLDAYNRGANSRDTTSQLSSLPSNIWGSVSNFASGAFKSNVISPLSKLYNSVVSGEEKARQITSNINEEASRDFQLARQFTKQGSESIESPFKGNRTIFELQARNLGGTEDFTDFWRSSVADASVRRNNRDGKFIPTNTERKGVSFNPDVKTEKQYTLAIDNAVMAKTGQKVHKDSPYRVYKEGDEYVVEVATEKIQMGGKEGDTVKKIVTTTPLRFNANELPPAIVNSVGGVEDWNTSSMNSNFKPINLKYNLPRNSVERSNRMNKFFAGAGSKIPQAEMQAFESSGFMQTAENIVQPYISSIKTPQQRAAVEGLMNAQYGSTVVKVPGQGFKTVLTVNNQPTSLESGILKTYDLTDVSVWTDRLVKLYITNNIQRTLSDN